MSGKTSSSAGREAKAGRAVVFAIAVAAACTCLGGRATAGERPGGPAGEQPAGEKGPPKAFAVDTIDFEWDFTNRRDPFEFEPVRKGFVHKRNQEESVGIFGTKKPKGPKPPKPPDGTPNVEQYAKSIAEEAEVYLLVRDFAKAADRTGEALNRIAPGDLPEGRLLERLKRLRDTAQRLDERAKIERRFRELAISVEGIVWNPGGAVALINGGVRSEGDVVEGATIEAIRRDEVIFVLEKGVRVRKMPME